MTSTHEGSAKKVRGKESRKDNCDEVYLLQHAKGLVLVVQGEIASIILIAPRSVTPFPKFLSAFSVCYSLHKKLSDWQLKKIPKTFCGRTGRLDSERHGEQMGVRSDILTDIAPSGPSSGIVI